ncbi:cyclic nucleotide-gated channel cone photoreceptor subunit alpha-like isoform X2 [Lytechinus variegatus]|uniref:cyclic nucleotide-gated channel cone photoreceptor subunit alpha-like isoform X2 n=1 Tax=Lytechinus variegatus TaxID=7654 RepID=UPI001BB29289|nr:cyclic nucleotide-gated channel cone photoreceptor subunit alpha-like isoform X2 [Lytechinus variegatus]
MGAACQKENNWQTEIFLRKLSSRNKNYDKQTDNADGKSAKSVIIELSKKEQNEQKKTIVVPDGDFLLYWLTVVSIAVVYNLWVLIAREAWPELQDKSPVGWFLADYFCDFIYILDIVVQARTAYLEHGLHVVDEKKLLRHYVRSRYVVQIVGYLAGIFIFASVVGQVSAIISNRNATRMDFERQVDHAKRYMRRNNVPRSLQLRVLRWYDYTWSRGATHGQCDVNSLGLLPDTHRTELALHVNLQTLKRVSLFKVCPPEILPDLVLRMKFRICTPGDIVCKLGAIAREMFFISDGLFKVTDGTGRIVASRASGEYFGEIGILNLKENSYRRTANVQSVGFSELFTLSKDDIIDVLKDYPAVMNTIQEEGMRRLETLRPQPNKIENDAGDGHSETNVDDDTDDQVSKDTAILAFDPPEGTTKHQEDKAEVHDQGQNSLGTQRVSVVETEVQAKNMTSSTTLGLEETRSDQIGPFAQVVRIMEEERNTLREKNRTLQQDNESKHANILALENRIAEFEEMQWTTTDRIKTLERESESKEATIQELKKQIKLLEDAESNDMP